MPSTTVIERPQSGAFKTSAALPCCSSNATPDSWYPVTSVDAGYAEDLCAGCPRLKSCLDDALRQGEQGIWGGTTEAERRLMLAADPKLGDAERAGQMRTACAWVGLNDGLTLMPKRGGYRPARPTPVHATATTTAAGAPSADREVPSAVEVNTAATPPVAASPVEVDEPALPASTAPAKCMVCEHRTRSGVVIEGAGALNGQLFRLCSACAKSVGREVVLAVAA